MYKLILMLLMMFSVQATTSFDVKKINDGKLILCKSKTDVFRSRLGAYSAEVKSMNVEDDVLKVSMELTFKQCSDTGEGFFFFEKAPYDELSFTSLGSNSTRHEIEVTPLDVRFKVYVDEEYDLLVDESLENKAVQMLDFEIPVNHGEKPHFIFFVTKKMQWINKTTKFEATSSNSFGAFRANYVVQ